MNSPLQWKALCCTPLSRKLLGKSVPRRSGPIPSSSMAPLKIPSSPIPAPASTQSSQPQLEDVLTGWTITGSSINTVVGGGSIDQIGNYWQASNGRQSVDLDGSPGTTDESAMISQVINTVAGQQYALTFDISGNPDDPAANSNIKTVFVSATGTPGTIFTFDTTGIIHGNMNWTSEALSFTATGTSTTISFDSRTNGWYGPALDNVSVDTVGKGGATPVPTPSALSAGGLSLGTIGAISFLRKKRRTA